jgi:tRNA(Ile)-lysidine synthase
MPEFTRLGRGHLARPLLGFSRAVLHRYAVQHDLAWIDDPSNTDTRFDRNFLRHEVMPLLQQRWPATASVLSRVAEHMAESAGLLQQLAAEDIQQHLVAGNRLSVTSLLRLDDARLRNVLRYWLVEVAGVSMPDRRHLQRIVREVLPAAEDASPVVHWRGGEVRRYRDELYALQAATVPVDATQIIAWNGKQPLKLATQQLIPQQITGQGLAPQWLEQQDLSVRFICQPYQANPQQEGLLVTLKNA